MICLFITDKSKYELLWMGSVNWYEKSTLCGRYRKLNNSEKSRIYQFRDNPTPAENFLWNILRNKQIYGLKFRRQHKIGQFIVDFYCHSAGLIIEVDGQIHQKLRIEDQIRSQYFENIGLQVLRFSNHEVLLSIESVKDRILHHPLIISNMPPRG